MSSDGDAGEKLEHDREIGGYRLRRVLGTGGMGTVYEAEDGAGIAVALKVLHPAFAADPETRERLRREVATLHRVRGAQVAQVIDAEVDQVEAFIVTELIHGRTLDQSVLADGPLDADELADLAAGLATALQQIHEVGVVHRDLKPSNVMLTESGPVLIDFGISQLLDDARITRTGLVTGTPGYVDPVVLSGAPPDQLGDWWGWAALLAFAATGRDPFGKGPAVLTRSHEGRLDVEGLDRATADVLTAALNPDPRLRLPPAAVIEYLADIAAGRGDGVPSAPPAGASMPPRAGGYGSPAGVPPTFPPGTPPPIPPAQGARDSLVESWPRFDRTVAEPVRAYPPEIYRAFPAVAPGPRPARSRPLLTLVAWLILAAVAMRAAGVTAIGFGAVLMAAGGWGWGERRLRERRLRHGHRRRDRVLVGLGSPWHLASGVVTALPGLLAGAIVGFGTWLVAVQFIDPGFAAGLAVALLVFVAWFVPSSNAARDGVRRVWAVVTPNRGAAAAVTVVLVLALVVLGLWGLAGLEEAVWEPLPMPTP